MIYKTFYFVQPFKTLTQLTERAESVRRNGIMTPHERQQENERIAAQKRGLFSNVVRALDSDWTTVKYEYRTLRRAQAAASERAGKRFDFQRLQYERNNMRDFLQKATVKQIEKRYKELDIENDTHALRAFTEEALIAFDNRQFATDEAIKVNDLKQEFESMRDMITVTSEMRDLAKQGEVLNDKITELYSATQKARGEYYRADLMATDENPFDKMSEGVRPVQHVVPETLATETNLVGLDNWLKD